MSDIDDKADKTTKATRFQKILDKLELIDKKPDELKINLSNTINQWTKIAIHTKIKETSM